MTAITDTILIIETIIGRDLTNEQLIYVADAIIYAAYGGATGPDLGNVFVDPENPTNEEKALVAKEFLYDRLINMVDIYAAAQQGIINAAATTAAIAEARLNLEPIPVTPTPTPTVTPTITVSPTVTPTITVSPTITPTATVTMTPTPSG